MHLKLPLIRNDFNADYIIQHVEQCSEQWMRKYPNLIIIWSLPYPPDFLTMYKKIFEDAKISRGLSSAEYSQVLSMSKTFYSLVTSLKQQWLQRQANYFCLDLNEIFFSEDKSLETTFLQENTSAAVYPKNCIEADGLTPTKEFCIRFEKSLKVLIDNIIAERESQVSFFEEVGEDMVLEEDMELEECAEQYFQSETMNNAQQDIYNFHMKDNSSSYSGALQQDPFHYSYSKSNLGNPNHYESFNRYPPPNNRHPFMETVPHPVDQSLQEQMPSIPHLVDQGLQQPMPFRPHPVGQRFQQQMSSMPHPVGNNLQQPRPSMPHLVGNNLQQPRPSMPNPVDNNLQHPGPSMPHSVAKRLRQPLSSMPHYVEQGPQQPLPPMLHSIDHQQPESSMHHTIDHNFQQPSQFRPHLADQDLRQAMPSSPRFQPNDQCLQQPMSTGSSFIGHHNRAQTQSPKFTGEPGHHQPTDFPISQHPSVPLPPQSNTPVPFSSTRQLISRETLQLHTEPPGGSNLSVQTPKVDDGGIVISGSLLANLKNALSFLSSSSEKKETSFLDNESEKKETSLNSDHEQKDAPTLSEALAAINEEANKPVSNILNFGIEVKDFIYESKFINFILISINNIVYVGI